MQLNTLLEVIKVKNDMTLYFCFTAWIVLQYVPWWFPFLYSCWLWFPVLCKPPCSSDSSRITSCSLICLLSCWVGSRTEWSFLCLRLSNNRPVTGVQALVCIKVLTGSAACFRNSISWRMCCGGKVWWSGTSCGVGEWEGAVLLQLADQCWQAWWVAVIIGVPKNPLQKLIWKIKSRLSFNCLVRQAFWRFSWWTR